MNPLSATARAAAAAPATGAGRPRAELRRLSDELQAVFLNQLFQAMRASVPETEGMGADPGKELFTQLFDERVAAEASRRMRHGVGDALYRQLAARLDRTANPETP